MKTKLFLLAISLALIVGCAAVPKCPPCPAEDTVFMTPWGLAEMKKGFFDTGEGEFWMHTDDLREQEKKQQGF